jgi:hypothetical protein
MIDFRMIDVQHFENWTCAGGSNQSHNDEHSEECCRKNAHLLGDVHNYEFHKATSIQQSAKG